MSKVDVHAFMAIDPGGTTGVAAGYVATHPTRKKTLETMQFHKALEVNGDWLSQAKQLANLMDRFVMNANVEKRLPFSNIHISAEDFVLRRRQEGGATGNLTSVWVIAGAVALFNNPNIEIRWQQPSAAKTLATDQRLKEWDLWAVGSAHCRDANRHLCLHIDHVLQTL